MKIFETAYTPSSLPDAVVGVPFSQNIKLLVGKKPISFDVSAGIIPPGLSWQNVDANAGTLTLAGTPTSAGDFPFTLSGTDADGTVFSINY